MAKETGYWEGLTGNYIRVLVPSKDDLMGHLVKVKFKRFDGETVLSSLV